MAEPKYHEAVFAVVRRIPKGRVASYRMVATLAGFPRTARFVGRALRLGRGLPWWRVIAHDGRIVIMDPELRMEQLLRLQSEGVAVSPDGMVDLGTYAWRPRGLTAPGPPPPPSPEGPARRPRPSSPSRRR